MRKLNSKEAARLVHEDLLENADIQAYQQYEQAIAQHPEIAALEDELKALQQEMILKKAHDEDFSDLLAEYTDKKKQFENHPLVVNYLNVKEDVNNLLDEVEMLINNGIALK